MNGHPLEMEDLTPEQIDFYTFNIWNGVGSKEFCVKPPAMIFTQPSYRHDFFYYRGGTERDRVQADILFLVDGLYICEKFFHGAKRQFYEMATQVYYEGLSFLGPYAWEYYPRPAETWEELVEHWQAFKDGRSQSKSWAKRAIAAYAYNLYDSKLACESEIKNENSNAS